MSQSFAAALLYWSITDAHVLSLADPNAVLTLASSIIFDFSFLFLLLLLLMMLLLLILLLLIFPESLRNRPGAQQRCVHRDHRSNPRRSYNFFKVKYRWKMIIFIYCIYILRILLQINFLITKSTRNCPETLRPSRVWSGFESPSLQ